MEITVFADWLECELAVELRRPGEQAVAIADALGSDAEGLRLARLPRDVGASVIESRLKKIGEKLVARRDDLLR